MFAFVAGVNTATVLITGASTGGVTVFASSGGAASVVSGNMIAKQVMSGAASALDGTSYFLTSASVGIVTITNVQGGSVLDAFDVDVGVVVNVTAQGIDTEMPSLVAASLIYTEEIGASVRESIRIAICHPIPGSTDFYGFYMNRFKYFSNKFF